MLTSYPISVVYSSQLRPILGLYGPVGNTEAIFPLVCHSQHIKSHITVWPGVLQIWLRLRHNSIFFVFQRVSSYHYILPVANAMPWILRFLVFSKGILLNKTIRLFPDCHFWSCSAKTTSSINVRMCQQGASLLLRVRDVCFTAETELEVNTNFYFRVNVFKFYSTFVFCECQFYFGSQVDRKRNKSFKEYIYFLQQNGPRKQSECSVKQGIC